MEALNINRWSKLYHLRPSQRERQRLLDASLHQAFEEDLDSALAAAGFEDYGEICVRLVQVPLSFNFGQSQSETSRHWSRIIAHHIRQEIEKGGDNIVRYRSHLHALIAFADDISRNDMQRSWSWNQIGLANLATDASLSQARNQLVTALLREPAALLTVFTALAAKQRLLSWLRDLSSEDRAIVIDGLVSAAGIEQHWLTTKPEKKSRPKCVVATGIEQASPLTDNSQSRSSLLIHLLANASNAAKLPVEPRIWVILVLLEIEPMLFKRSPQAIAPAIAAVEKWLLPVLGAGNQATEQDIEPVETTEQKSSFDQIPQADVDRQIGDPTMAVNESAAVKKPLQENVKKSAKVPPPASTGTDAANKQRQHNTQSSQTSQTRQQGDQVEIIEAQTAAAQLEAATPTLEYICSEFAGLFLLLPVLAETADDTQTRLINRIAAEPAFAARPLSWVLYRLTTRWLSIPTNDPALRIFCDIDIDADGPWASDDKATSAEASALAEYATAVEDGLLLRFNPDGIDDAQVIETLCRRNARLLIENGWLELVFELDGVDTNIRRAGLDLDPGFVAWLGKVVKIRYE